MRIQVNPTAELQDYVARMSLREPDVLRNLRARTDALPERLMQISPEQGQFLGVLLRAIGATRAIEIGVFTGYSLLSTALALPDHGTVIGCDTSTEWTSIAMDFCRQAGVADKVDLRIGDAAETLRQLVREEAAGTFDFVFIDADKTGYASYFDLALTLLRTGGLIVVDNVLWHSAVIDDTVRDDETEALRAFNARVLEDKRVDISLVPFADGLTFAVKR
jgi:O-methyltransferase